MYSAPPLYDSIQSVCVYNRTSEQRRTLPLAIGNFWKIGIRLLYIARPRLALLLAYHILDAIVVVAFIALGFSHTSIMQCALVSLESHYREFSGCVSLFQSPQPCK